MLIESTLLMLSNPALHPFATAPGWGPSAQDLGTPHLGYYEDASGIDQNLEALVSKASEMFGSTAGAEMANDLLGPNPAIGVGELLTPFGPDGVGVAGKILINTKHASGESMGKSVELLAGVLHHEWQHARSAMQAGQLQDPQTSGPCGSCAHSLMHSTSALQVPCAPDFCEYLENAAYAAAESIGPV